MNDVFEKITDLSIKIQADNEAKGFWDEQRNVGEMLMLVVTELSEALEAHRTGLKANKQSYLSSIEGVNDSGHELTNELIKQYFELNIKNTFEDEIADAIIRLLDMCGGLGINIGWYIEAKLNYNKTRTYKHGKRY